MGQVNKKERYIEKQFKNKIDMIFEKSQLKSVLLAEYSLYNEEYNFDGIFNKLKLYLLRDRRYIIWIFQKNMRYADYYRNRKDGNKILNAILYLIYCRLRNKMGEKLGLDFVGYNIPNGLQLYHPNIVINNRAHIGENLHLYGENVIGNNGKTSECPTIGNNVMMGAGAKVFGNVVIADDIRIGAGAIVISSFTEKGITIGGIPARKIK